LPKLLRRNASAWPRMPGMREKERGIWQAYSWRECQPCVRDFCTRAGGAGFQRGDKLSVLGDKRARLYWAQLRRRRWRHLRAALQDSIASELVHVLRHAEVSVVVADDQEQVDKVLSLSEELPNLRWVIYEDPRGMSAYGQKCLRSLRGRRGNGPRIRQGASGLLRARAGTRQRRGRGLDRLHLGTTGRSKGAMLTQANMIATVGKLCCVERSEKATIGCATCRWAGLGIRSFR
jgi:long-chain acyl-CoA synthetase